MKNDLTEYLAECNVINNSRHGFTKKRLCCANLLFLEEVYEKLDEDKGVETR